MTIWTDLADTAFAVDFVDAGGLRTRSLRAGQGEPLIFLHGTSRHTSRRSSATSPHTHDTTTAMPST